MMWSNFALAFGLAWSLGSGIRAFLFSVSPGSSLLLVGSAIIDARTKYNHSFAFVVWARESCFL